MHSFEWGATKMPSFEGGKKQQSANDGGEDEGNDANAARVCNNEAFKAALLSGANASWQRER